MRQYFIIGFDGAKLSKYKQDVLSKKFSELACVDEIDVIQTDEREMLALSLKHDSVMSKSKETDVNSKYNTYIAELIRCITTLCDILNVDTTPKTDFTKYELALYRKISACKTVEDVEKIQTLIKRLYTAVTDSDEQKCNYTRIYLEELGYKTSDIIALYNDSSKITISSNYE